MWSSACRGELCSVIILHFVDDKPHPLYPAPTCLYVALLATLLLPRVVRISSIYTSVNSVRRATNIVDVMDRLPAAPRRRRSSVVVVVCFVIVVADFIPHHSAAASEPNIAEQLDKLAKEDSDKDKNKLIAGAKGTYIVASWLHSALLHFRILHVLQIRLCCCCCCCCLSSEL